MAGLNIGAQPFVKWPGTKSQHLHILTQALPANFAEMPDVTYIEPFVGGGALLFHMLQTYPNIRRAIINDNNLDVFHVVLRVDFLKYLINSGNLIRCHVVELFIGILIFPSFPAQALLVTV